MPGAFSDAFSTAFDIGDDGASAPAPSVAPYWSAGRPERSLYRNRPGQKARILAIDTATGLPATGVGASLALFVSKAHAAPAALADTTATEVDPDKAKGAYLFDLAQAETDGYPLDFSGTSSLDGIEVVPLTVYPVTINATSGLPSVDVGYAGGVEVDQTTPQTIPTANQNGAAAAAAILATPSNKLATVADGSVNLNLAQALADVKTATVGGALHGGWIAAFGKVVKDKANKLLKLFGIGSQSAALATFNLDNADDPTSRTPV